MAVVGNVQYMVFRIVLNVLEATALPLKCLIFLAHLSELFIKAGQNVVSICVCTWVLTRVTQIIVAESRLAILHAQTWA